MHKIRCVIVFVALTLAKCEPIEKSVIELPVRVHIVQSNYVEFKFDKNTEIEPISIREENMIFNSHEDEKTINFRSPKTIKEENSYGITVTLKYRYAGKNDIKERTFQHHFRHKPEETIIVRFPLPTSQPLAPIEICSSQNCGENDLDLPQNSLGEQIDAVPKSIDESHTEIFIDKETLEESCDSDYGHTKELLNTALQYSKIGTHLLLKGVKNIKANPVDTIRSVISKELELPYLEYKILQAKYIDDGLLFEMESTQNVLEILTESRTKLEPNKDGLEIELTPKTIFDDLYYDIDIRSGDS